MPDAGWQPLFSPLSFRTARLARGLKIADVGRAVGTSRQYIQQIEDGERRPNEAMVEHLAAILDVEVKFLGAPPARPLAESECFFRSLTRTSGRERERARALVVLFAQLIVRLTRDVEFPRIELPRFRVRTDADVESAALRCREALGLGQDAPVANITRAVERAGVFVVDLDGVAEAIDAFSVRSDPIVVARNPHKGSSSRARFDVAHELAHLVLHSEEGGGTIENREEEADRFASAFLLPRETFSREFPVRARWSWPELYRLKARWGASFGAMITRAKNLGLIGGAHYKSAWIHMSRMGWKRNPEPEEPPREPPSLLLGAFRAIFGARGIRPIDIARELGWTPSLFARAVGSECFRQLSEIGEGGDIIALRRV